MKENWRAFWTLFFGMAMLCDFTLVPLGWFFGFDSKFLIVAGAFFTGILAPLVAWVMIEQFGRDDAGYYYTWELEELTTIGKQTIFWGNPVGWLLLILYWCALKATMRWPTLGLIIAILIP